MITKTERLLIEDEARTIDAVVNGRPWPADIKGYEVEFGLDSTNDPAVRIWLEIEEDNNPPDEKIKRLNRFRQGIEDALLEEGFSHWPYVNFRVPQPAKRRRAR